jgi:purine-nucleoside phosphorylase
MAILDNSEVIWREALSIPTDSEPDVLILEGTWWREVATRNRLELMSEVQELNFPEIYTGKWKHARVAYCCAYGAARAIEPAHIFAQLGTPLIIQIGTCGTLDINTGTGVVVLPQTCAARDGISQAYGAGAEVRADPHWVKQAESALKKMGIETQCANHLTWPSLFAQSDQMCTDWTNEGLLSIDMETSAVIAVANYFGVSAISMLTVWDSLPNGRTFLDPLSPAEKKSLNKSNEAVFAAALSLAEEVASNREILNRPIN